MRPVRFSLLRSALVVALVALAAAGPALAQGRVPRVLRLGDLSGRPAAFTPADARAVAPPAWASKLDPSARLLALGVSPASIFGGGATTMRSADGQPTVDLLVRTTTPQALAAMPGVEVRAVAGDIAVVRAPLGGIEALARSSATLYIEASQTREGFNDTGRADLRADVVNAGGGGLPRAFNGEGVVVGVVDSGLDVSHPDFLNGSGSRVAFLLEMLENGGQTEYTRAQISANPGGIPERDFNGHGTHVTGSAAGAGGINPNLRGVAAAADIIFVKGNRLNNGQSSFSDTDVIAGVDFIFQRAATLGEPAVVNLSLGGHFGPHDGTSLYEQALTNLGGPGRVVVAAVGNDGQSYVHAGATSTGGSANQTFWLVNNPQFALAELWYDGGVLNQFAIGAYFFNQGTGQLDFLGEMGVNAGQVLANGQNGVPFVVQGQTIANVIIDASTTNDPRNGDGNVLFLLQGGNGIDLQNIVWSVASIGQQSGRIDMWARSSEFYGSTLGFPTHEVPGDRQYTVSPPSTALGLIGAAAHVTRNSWTDIDGQFHQSLENDPNNPGGPPIVPGLGTLASFSSRGPTRDGRAGMDVSAPGNRIASTLSGHVTIGTQEHPRQDVLQGGGYILLQGTSMASPHVAGTVALMLQADPTLTPAEVRSILRETARADGNTGGLPNTGFGYGKADALAAVQRTLQLCAPSCGGGGGGNTVAEVEPNNTAAQAQSIGGGSPIIVNGQASQDDAGELSIDYGGGDVDDFEDLFRITTTATGATFSLAGFNRDMDLFLINEATGQIVDGSNQVGATVPESLPRAGQPAIPAGTYLIAVSIYDGDGPGQTAYTLTATGSFTVDDEDAPGDAALTLSVPFPNPTLGAADIDFSLPTAQSVRVTVFDVLGREVARLADGDQTAGPHRLRLDASALGAGVYTVRLVAGETVRTQRLVVAR